MTRNDFIYHFQEIVELILQKFTKKMKQLKEGINEERERLINANNQTINSLEQLERKLMKRLLKSIEDEEGNVFGGYINAKIDCYGYERDPNAFIFSIQSNGRLEQPMKSESKEINAKDDENE